MPRARGNFKYGRGGNVFRHHQARYRQQGKPTVSIVNPSFDGRRIWFALGRRLDLVWLAIGIVLRLKKYADNTPFWMDELSLYANLVNQPIFSFAKPLSNTQLAPPGFLVVERLAALILGPSRPAMRLFPFVCAIMALLCFHRVAHQYLTKRAAVIALALFAVSYDLIYFGGELKQYSSDVAIGLICTLAALAVDERWSWGRGAFFVMTAAIAPWFSHPSMFMIAGLGMTLLVKRFHAKRWREVGLLAMVGLVAGLSSLGTYRVSMKLLDNHANMWVFWDFAFLKLPPRSWFDVSTLSYQLFEALVNPANLIVGAFPRVSTIYVVTMILLGIVVILRRSPATLAMIVMPILLTMVASGLGRYPFHGRLILFLLPAIYLLIAAGTDALGELTGKRFLARILIGLLFLQPVLSAAYREIFNYERSFSPYGDLHDNPIPRPVADVLS